VVYLNADIIKTSWSNFRRNELCSEIILFISFIITYVYLFYELVIGEKIVLFANLLINNLIIILCIGGLIQGLFLLPTLRKNFNNQLFQDRNAETRLEYLQQVSNQTGIPFKFLKNRTKETIENRSHLVSNTVLIYVVWFFLISILLLQLIF